MNKLIAILLISPLVWLVLSILIGIYFAHGNTSKKAAELGMTGAFILTLALIGVLILLGVI